MLLQSQCSASLHAQQLLRPCWGCNAFLTLKAVTVLLMAAGIFTTQFTDALQLRPSPQLQLFSSSSSSPPPGSSYIPAAAALVASVASSDTDSATASAQPLTTVKGITKHTDAHLPSSTPSTKRSGSRAARATTRKSILLSPAALNAPSFPTASAVVEGVSAAGEHLPAASTASASAAAPASFVASAAATPRPAMNLAYMGPSALASFQAGRRRLNTGDRQDRRSTSQRQYHEDAAVPVHENKQRRQVSWLHAPLLQQQRLAAAPAGAPSVAVVEGEKVNGKSVRDWTVERTIYQALHMALAEEMQRDPSVCVMGEDVGHYGGSYKVTKDLHAVFGNLRVMDTPICENTFTGMAIGAAMNGLRPVVEGMNMGFLLLAFNQISNNAGMVRYTSGGSFDVPVVIRGPGGVGKQLGPEHSQRIEAYLMAVPGLKMVACSTPYNARGLLKSAIREDNPVVFFEHVLTYNMKENIPLLPYTLPLDRAEVVREGNDVTVLAYGKLRYVATEAAKQLDSLGVSTEVLDLISLKPLDMESVCRSLRKTGRCVILDESSKTGGIGGEILSQVVENCADELLRPPVRLATKDIPTPYARDLEDATIVTPADVVNAALWMVSSRSQPTVGRHWA